MGITNTISRAELAAIAAAVTHGYSHIATDSITSLHQIKKQLKCVGFVVNLAWVSMRLKIKGSQKD